MATAEEPETRTLNDLEFAVLLLATGQKEPEFTARIEAEADKISEDIRMKHGVLDVAVSLVRETRDGG